MFMFIELRNIEEQNLENLLVEVTNIVENFRKIRVNRSNENTSTI